MNAREPVVRVLTSAINDVFTAVCERNPDITADEIFCAYLTAARNMLSVARDAGTDPARLQAVVHQLLAECYDPKARKA